MTHEQQVAEWLKSCIKANDYAGTAISLAGLLIKHHDLINNAISGKLPKDNEDRVKNWIVKQLPVSKNSNFDASCFETAWVIYYVSRLQELSQNPTWHQRETDFLVDVRTRYLAKRLGE